MVDVPVRHEFFMQEALQEARLALQSAEVPVGAVVVINGELMKFYQGEVFRKEDADLRDAFNAELATFRGSPEQATLFAPFGITSAENPPQPPKTAAELCAGK